MPIIKCKNCGGDIELTADKTFGTCETCGSTMTLPKIDDEQQAEICRKEAERAEKKRKTIVAVVAAVAVMCIAVVIVVTKVIIPSFEYNKAVGLMEAGSYEEAIAAFGELNGYKDSEAQSGECRYLDAVARMEVGSYEEAIVAFESMNGYKDSAEQIEQCYIEIVGKDTWAQIQNGSYTFGTYGAEAIEWIVLEHDGTNVLLLSKYALDAKPYNEEWVDVTWEKCTLRSWLNNDFYNTAFSTEEQSLIETTTVTADKNPDYSTTPGNDTEDKVFLLSIPEAEKYFPTDEARKCVPTAYAISNGAWTSDSNPSDGKDICCWWSRSPGRNCSTVAYVNYFGSVNTLGDYVSNNSYSVRPALWVNLAS